MWNVTYLARYINGIWPTDYKLSSVASQFPLFTEDPFHTVGDETVLRVYYFGQGWSQYSLPPTRSKYPRRPWSLWAGMAQWWERSPPTNVARVQFRPGVICGLFVVSSRPCSEGFSPGSSVFFPPQKIHIPIRLGRGPAWKPTKADVASTLNVVIYLIWKEQVEGIFSPTFT